MIHKVHILPPLALAHMAVVVLLLHLRMWSSVGQAIQAIQWFRSWAVWCVHVSGGMVVLLQLRFTALARRSNAEY